MPSATDTAEEFSRRYAVFISYRHADNKERGRQWATWLHQALETYEIPQDLIGTNNLRSEPIPASLYPVFRDEEELPADADLSQNIRRALEHSATLVVLCSPRAVASRHVGDEIRYFKELGKSERILGLIIDGEPNTTNDPEKAKSGMGPELECLPENLRHGVKRDDGSMDWSQLTEPIAADVRPDGRPAQGWTTGAAYRESLEIEGKLTTREIDEKAREYEHRLELAKLKVIAGALGAPLGTLTQRDKAMQLAKARRRARTLHRWLAAVGVLALLAVAGGIYALFQRQQAIAQQGVAEAQRKEALKTASATDFSVADFKMKQGDPAGALPYLADALRQNPRNKAATALTISILQNNPVLPITLPHDGPVESASFSADGRYVLTASGSVMQVWDSHTGKRFGLPMQSGSAIATALFASNANGIVAADGQNGEIWWAQLWDSRSGKPAGPRVDGIPFAHGVLSFDGQRALIVSSAGAQIWDLNTGKPVGPPIWGGVGPKETLRSFSGEFSADGKQVVIMHDYTAEVYKVDTGAAVGKPMKGVAQIRLSADAKRLLSISGLDSESVEFFDVATGTPVGATIPYYDLIQSSQFSPSGNAVVTVFGGQYERGAVSEKVLTQVWNVMTGKAIGQSLQHRGAVNWVEFSPDGRWLVTASDDKTSRVWDARTGEQAGLAMQHADKVNTARFSPDGKWIVTASADNTARLWPLQTGRLVGEILRYDAVGSPSFSPDGNSIVAGTSNKTAEIREIRSGKLVAQSMAFAGPVGFSAFSPDGSRVVTVSPGGMPADIAKIPEEAHIWNARTGQPIGEPMRHGDSISSASFSPDGSRVLTASHDGTARLWAAATGKRAGPPLKCGLWVTSAEFNSNGRKVITASGDGMIRIWDAQSAKLALKEINFVHYPDSAVAAHFSPDGKWVVAVANSQIARIWDAGSGQQYAGPIQNGDRIDRAVFTPEGKGLMLTAGSVVQIWNMQTAKPLTEPMRNDVFVSPEISRDGRWVMTATRNNAARLWDAQTGKGISQTVGSQGRGFFDWKISPDGRWVSADNLRYAFVWNGVIVVEEAPSWLADLAEAVSGLELTQQRMLEPSQHDSRALRQTLQRLIGNDDLSCFARWFVADPGKRAISPGSPVSVPEFVWQRLQEKTADSVEEAYRMDPGNPVLLASLANFEQDKSAALFLCRHAVHRARIEGPPEKVGRVLAIAKSIFPDLPEFGDPASVPSPGKR